VGWRRRHRTRGGYHDRRDRREPGHRGAVACSAWTISAICRTGAVVPLVAAAAVTGGPRRTLCNDARREPPRSQRSARRALNTVAGPCGPLRWRVALGLAFRFRAFATPVRAVEWPLFVTYLVMTARRRGSATAGIAETISCRVAPDGAGVIVERRFANWQSLGCARCSRARRHAAGVPGSAKDRIMTRVQCRQAGTFLAVEHDPACCRDQAAKRRDQRPRGRIRSGGAAPAQSSRSPRIRLNRITPERIGRPRGGP